MTLTEAKAKGQYIRRPCWPERRYWSIPDDAWTGFVWLVSEVRPCYNRYIDTCSTADALADDWEAYEELL